MDLMPTTEQNELVNWARSILDAEMPIKRLALERGERPKPDPSLAKLAELGWIGLALPERFGGSGLSVIEEVLLMKEAGRHVPPLSLLATQLAAQIAADAGNEELTRKLLTLEAQAAIAVPSELGHDALQAGTPLYVLDGHKPDHIVLFTAQTIAVVSPDQCSLQSEVESIDESVLLTSGILRSPPAHSHPRNSSLWLRGQALVASMLVGLAEGSLDMAVEYAKMREQFGKPIGSFQAIQHRCADIALQIASARSQTVYATLALSHGLADAPFQVLAARMLASKAALSSGAGNIQIHGGMGFHVESGVHWYLKRAKVASLLGGTETLNLETLIAGPSADASAAA